MPYEILKNIPHKRVITDSNKNNGKEIYDLYQLGLFGKDNVELVELQPNSFYRQHYHKYSEATIYIILGTGTFILDNQKINYHTNIRIKIDKGSLHGFVTDTKTLFLSIQSPPILNIQDNSVDLHYPSTLNNGEIK